MFFRKPSTKDVPLLATSKATSTTPSRAASMHSITTDSAPSTPMLGAITVPPTPSAESVFGFTPADLKQRPPPSGTYNRSQALDDIPLVRKALHLFLGGQMLESENILREADPHEERLYTASGLGLIQVLKGLMSFEEPDIKHALESVQHAAMVAAQHRRPASLTNRLAGLVVSNGVSFIKGMTPVERHAELVYSECLLQKAILGIVSSGDWMTFIKEFLNIRSATNVYRTLGDFISIADAEAQARGEGPEDKTVDDDFRSGVALGNGTNALCLSLLPNSVSNVIALFGYKGDRLQALATLSKPGGWTEDSDEPSVPRENEGLRRPCAELMLLIFHLFISNVTYTGVDIDQARKLVEYNLRLYPKGVFFIFFKGRLNVIQGRLESAIQEYQLGVELTEYQSLKGVAQWEMGFCSMVLGHYADGVSHWRAQEASANWSKAVYAYGLACCLYEAGEKEEAAKYFAKVSKVLRRIAGKSIPAEKFVARKSRKFEAQGNRLLAPSLELTYFLGAFPHTPRKTLVNHTIPKLETALAELERCSSDPSKYGNGKGYWDDYALAKLLHGASMRYLAYPHPETVETDDENATFPQDTANEKAFQSLNWVIENGPKIELDHQIVYAAHLELGRLYACNGDKVQARKELELVVSGKPLEVNAAGKKVHKYSMQNGIQVKTHSALEALDHGRRI